MQLEFRIPISPTPSFFAQVRLFNFALRRLDAPHYQNARLRIVVGDGCNLDAVRRANRWSENFNIEWTRTPDPVFAEFHWVGTANWRLRIPPDDVDVVILSDADTVLLGDIDPLMMELPRDRPALRGHMAHFPPPVGVETAAAGRVPSSSTPEFWPWLFSRFDLRWPVKTFPYSISNKMPLPASPAYFNMGFVALNAAALRAFEREIDETTRRILAETGSPMCCQIAVTIIAYRAAMDIDVLPADYNAANDLDHLSSNGLDAGHIRVLHYLRNDEVDRTHLRPEMLETFLASRASNPANILLQNLVREFQSTLALKPR